MSERAPPSPPVDHPRPSRRRQLLLYAFVVPLALLIAIVVLLGVVARGMGWQAYATPGISMAPTLEAGDFLFVDHRAYAEGRLPRRGDIIAHYVPLQVSSFPADGREPVYIKRVIGVPGDRVELRGGVPIVNGTPVVRDKVGDYPAPSGRPWIGYASVWRRMHPMRFCRQGIEAI